MQACNVTVVERCESRGAHKSSIGHMVVKKKLSDIFKHVYLVLCKELNILTTTKILVFDLQYLWMFQESERRKWSSAKNNQISNLVLCT